MDKEKEMIYNIYDKEDRIYLENLCYRHFKESNDNLSEMKKRASFLGINIKYFLIFCTGYVERNINKPEYVKLLDTLSLVKTDKEVVTFFERTKADYKYLQDNLLSYFIYYRPHKYYETDKSKYFQLRDKIKTYENYIYRRLDPIRAKKKIDFEYARNMVNMFINSRYSLVRFCFNNNILVSTFKSYVQKIKLEDEVLYNDYLQTLANKEYIKEQTITNDVMSLIDKIKENPDDFSYIDFCQITNYDPLELVPVADNILNIEDMRLFRVKVRVLRNVKVLTSNQERRLVEMNYTLNVDGNLIEADEETKCKVLADLHDKDIPVCVESFHDGLVRYYRNKKNKNI